MSQIDENSSDSTSQTPTASSATKLEGKDSPSVKEDEEADDIEDEDVLLQFDFEASINAKQKTLNTANSSSNIAGLVPNVSQLTSNLSAAQLKSFKTSELIEQEEMIEACDKEKEEKLGEVINTTKTHTTSFDMFAEDDEYETVSLN